MKRKTKIIIASTAVAAVLGVGLYSATTSAVGSYKRFGGHMGPMGGQVADKIFDEFDTNKNGKLTRQGIEAYRKKTSLNMTPTATVNWPWKSSKAFGLSTPASP